jgi:2-hydroxycyclohexanecarboxyl-CoA dehydrogenase
MSMTVDTRTALDPLAPFRLDGKIAIVTGAGRGIGAAIAQRLTDDGATVVAADLNEPPGELGRHVDVTSPESVESLIQQVTSAFGRIDVLVNNAGWDKAGPFLDSAPADWDRIVAINLYGVLHLCHAVLPVMIENGGGAVVNIGSDAGRVGSSGESVYSAAKGGIIAFTKTIAREMARHKITANCVCPGPTDTALFASVVGDDPRLRESLIRSIPFRRLAEPADIANAVAFLASPDASYITGQTMSVSGGLTMS